MKNNKLIEELIDLIKGICNLEDVEILESDYDKPLAGKGSKFDLDSLDFLEIGAEMQRRYSVRVDDKNKSREIFKSLLTMKDFIINNSPEFDKENII